VLQFRHQPGVVEVTLEAASRGRSYFQHRVNGVQEMPVFGAVAAAPNGAARAVRGAGAAKPAKESFREAQSHGQMLFERFLSEDMKAIINQSLDDPTSVSMQVSTPGSSRANWEMLHDGTDFLCLRLPFMRLVSRITPAAPQQVPRVSALVVGADPEMDLPGVGDEVRQAADALLSTGAEVTVIEPQSATKAAVMKALERGNVNVLHFAGHSAYDEVSPAESHLRLADQKLFAHELGRLAAGSKLALVFLNSCNSAQDPADDVKAAGLAQALLRDGVDSVIGMRWVIGDEPGRAFSEAFYRALAEGRDVARAVTDARQRAGTVDWNDLTWLAPALYT
jgi:hypothetical protein